MKDTHSEPTKAHNLHKANIQQASSQNHLLLKNSKATSTQTHMKLVHIEYAQECKRYSNYILKV